MYSPGSTRRDSSCPLSCCSEMALDSCPAVVVPFGSEDRWFVELLRGAPFVVLVGSKVEAGKRARMALTIVGISSLVKGGWTRLFFEGSVVVEAPWTSLSPEQVSLLLCWFLAGPPVRLFFLHEGIIDTKKQAARPPLRSGLLFEYSDDVVPTLT